MPPCELTGKRGTMGALFNFLVMPPLLPLILAWLLAARLLALLIPFLVLPSVLLARRLHWSLPFLAPLFGQFGKVRGFFLRTGFEALYCMNVTRRFLTLPLRRSLPDCYIVGELPHTPTPPVP